MNGKDLDKNIFPAGTHVVLLSTCSGDPKVWSKSMEVGWCYKLREVSSTKYFMIELDNKGGTSNGWSTSDLNGAIDKMLLRQATEQEEMEYKRLGKPYSVGTLAPQVINNYQIY